MKRITFFLTLLLVSLAPCRAGELDLRAGDVVAFVGGTDMVRMQKDGRLEAALTKKFLETRPKFRDLAWEGDTVDFQSTVRERWRKDGFGGKGAFGVWQDQLKRVGATVVIAQFGKMESQVGKAGLAAFVERYGKLLDELGTGGAASGVAGAARIRMGDRQRRLPAGIHCCDPAARGEAGLSLRAARGDHRAGGIRAGGSHRGSAREMATRTRRSTVSRGARMATCGSARATGLNRESRRPSGCPRSSRPASSGCGHSRCASTRCSMISWAPGIRGAWPSTNSGRASWLMVRAAFPGSRQHRYPVWCGLEDRALLDRLFASGAHRCRAYAARIAGRWARFDLLELAAKDNHPRVRMEAVLGRSTASGSDF